MFSLSFLASSTASSLNLLMLDAAQVEQEIENIWDCTYACLSLGTSGASEARDSSFEI